MPQKPKPLSAKAWWRRVDKAREQRDKHIDTWDLLLEDYTPIVKKFGVAEDVKSNAHFRNVEQKKSQLFFKNPEMTLLPRSQMDSPLTGPEGEPMQGPDGQPITPDVAIPIHEEVLNYYLGPQEVNLPLLMDRLLFDCLCPSGFMVSKIGYRPYIQEITRPVLQPSVDEFGQPVVGPDGAPQEEPAFDEAGEPLTEKVPVLLKEEYFWKRVSPRKLLIPDEFRDTDFAAAPWLGVDFTMNFRDAKRLYKLPKDFTPTKGREEKLLGTGNTVQEATEQTITGVEIFLKAHLYKDDVRHPDVYWQLVLLDGFSDGKKDQIAVVDRISPYQEIDPETMQLTQDSMLGNPIHVGTIRDLSDRAYVPSDSAMTHTLVKEIDTYRNQTVKLRDANLTKFAYDTDKITPDALNAIETGDVGQFIALEGGVLAGGIETAIAPITKGSETRADLNGAFQLEQDLEKTLAIGANQVGAQTNTARTATELSIIQQSTNVRLKKEQDRVLAYVLAGVGKFDSLLQRFADDDEVVAIVGEDNVRRLQVWNRHVIAGRFAYEIRPDSQLDLDMAQERSTWMEYYNLTAQDPFNNRKESLKKLQRLFGVDPSKALQEPPPSGPPPPSVSFRFSGDDLINPMVREIIAQAGYQISPETVQEAQLLADKQAALGGVQPGVPGTAERIAPVSKRAEGLTGQLTGPTEAGQV
jgi:hypothetical protein